MLGDLGQRLDEAESMVKTALKLEPFNGAYLDSLGWIYYKQGKYNDAESWLHKAARARSSRSQHSRAPRRRLRQAGPHRTSRRRMGEALSPNGIARFPADMEPDKIAEVEKKVGSVETSRRPKIDPQDKHQ